MFSLIIVIISISLMAALAIAAIWYGTDAYNGNKIDAKAAQILNETEQIEGAILAYNVEKGFAPVIKDCAPDAKDCEPLEELITSGYLSSAPSSSDQQGKWSISTIFNDGTNDVSALVKNVSAEACARANEMVGYKGSDSHANVPELAESGRDRLIPICKVDLETEIVCCASN